MTNSNRLIYLPNQNDVAKDKISDLLRLYNISCFGSGAHLIVVNMKPSGINVPKHMPVNLKATLNKPKVKQAMQQVHAKLVTFDTALFNKLRTIFSKQYILKSAQGNHISFKSKTQRASFTIYRNGLINSSKDLLVIPLWNNIIRIIRHKKPIDPTDAI